MADAEGLTVEQCLRVVLNEEWDAWVDEEALPARATFQAPLAAPNILVELVVTAAV